MAALVQQQQHTLGSSITAAAAANARVTIDTFTVRQGTIWCVQSLQNIHPQTDATAYSDLQVELVSDGTVYARKGYLGAGSDEDDENETMMSTLIGPFTTDTSIRLSARNVFGATDDISVAGLAKLVQLVRNSQTA